MSNIIPVIRWVIACRTTNGGLWHLLFAHTLYHTYEEAAKQAFAWNEEGKGYQHKPVEVRVSVEEKP